MARHSSRSWYFNKQLNLSILLQIVFLASLILGSWLNLQRQLDLLQKDVTMLLQNQKEFCAKIESLQSQSISYDYRLRFVEQTLSKTTPAE